MFRKSLLKLSPALFLVPVMFVGACGEESSSGPADESSFQNECTTEADCGGLSCLCGVCSKSCADDSDCTDLTGAGGGSAAVCALNNACAEDGAVCLPAEQASNMPTTPTPTPTGTPPRPTVMPTVPVPVNMGGASGEGGGGMMSVGGGGMMSVGGGGAGPGGSGGGGAGGEVTLGGAGGEPDGGTSGSDAGVGGAIDGGASGSDAGVGGAVDSGASGSDAGVGGASGGAGGSGGTGGTAGAGGTGGTAGAGGTGGVGGTAGTGGVGGFGGTAGTGGTGGFGGTAGSGGTGGAGGAPGSTCEVLGAGDALITDFDTEPTTATGTFSFAGGAVDASFDLEDGGNPVFSLVDDGSGGLALSAQKNNDQNGAIITMSLDGADTCIDASAFTGISFRFRGCAGGFDSGAGSCIRSEGDEEILFSVDVDGNESTTSSFEFPSGPAGVFNTTWTTIQIPFADLDLGVTPLDGTDLTSIIFALVPEGGGAYQLIIDDLTFY